MITPSRVPFNGGKCLLVWVSSNAEKATITGLGERAANGYAYVYPTRGNTEFSVVFTNYTSTIQSTINVSVDDDPADQVLSTPLSLITIGVVRNINAGITSVNGRTTGTPSYIISSRLRPRVYIPPMSDELLGVL